MRPLSRDLVTLSSLRGIRPKINRAREWAKQFCLFVGMVLERGPILGLADQPRDQEADFATLHIPTKSPFFIHFSGEILLMDICDYKT
jgi:hypothetical protein